MDPVSIGFLWMALMVIAYLGAVYALTTWAGRDAEARGVPGWVATCVVFFLFLVGPFLWVLFRPPTKEEPFNLEKFRVQ